MPIREAGRKLGLSGAEVRRLECEALERLAMRREIQALQAA
jgi:hypothetical protein